MKTSLLALFVLLGAGQHLAKASVPSLRSAIIQTLALSDKYKVLRRGPDASGIEATRLKNGSARVRLVEFSEFFDQHQKYHRVVHELFVATFTTGGVKTRVASGVSRPTGNEASAYKRLCKAIAVAYSCFNPKYGREVVFDVEAQEKKPGTQWITDGQYYVRILPPGPGGNYGFTISKNFRVVGVLPGT